MNKEGGKGRRIRNKRIFTSIWPEAEIVSQTREGEKKEKVKGKQSLWPKERKKETHHQCLM